MPIINILMLTRLPVSQRSVLEASEAERKSFKRHVFLKKITKKDDFPTTRDGRLKVL